MIINPVTITIADHELVEAINALQRVVNRLTEGSPAHRRFEGALEGLIDARSAGLKRAAERRYEAMRLQDMEGEGT
jgi:hypothetical protein